jgi:uncharacterized LabA/DUF88 family protein
MRARGKTICFIDNSNIFSGQGAAGWRIDWSKFEQYLENGGPVWQTWFFASEDDPPRTPQDDFYKYLRNVLKFEVELYTLGCRTSKCQNCNTSWTTKTEKGVDVGLATKMLILGMNRAYETAILVSGDGDYAETVGVIKNLGLRVEVIGWQGTISNGLNKASSTPVVYLDSLKSQIELL